MNGADLLCDTLLANDVDVCFANPGTSEMHFVAALDRKPQMRCVLGLFEGVVTGAADGYARMTGKPAATLLHTGPGLANGLANMHNARRARTPMVNVVGDHARYHLQYDAPLTSDIESLARPMSHWVRRIGSPEAVGNDTAEAIAQAQRQPGQVCTLILPADCAWGELPANTSAPKVAPLAAARADGQHIADPDLLIRTGGETRISNFLLWQCAYSELYFSDCLWPDFDGPALDEALQDFAGRQRRFGKTSEQVQPD